jgi:hypothetical protein
MMGWLVKRFGVSVVVAIGLAGSGCGDRSSQPAAQATTTVKYVDQREALRGLTALRLNPSFTQVAHASLANDPTLVAAIEQRLSEAGLRMLTAAEFAERPGAAEMQIYPSVNGGLADAEQRPRQCCLGNVWASVIEGVTIDRTGQVHSRLPVWGVGSNRSCADAPASVRELAIEAVERFVTDLKKANEAPAAAPTTGGTAPH